MPMPLYGPMFSGFQPHCTAPGDRVQAGTADPWRKDWPDVQVETVLARPFGRIVTDHTTYLRSGRQLSTWWQWWRYPRRILAPEGAPL